MLASTLLLAAASFSSSQAQRSKSPGAVRVDQGRFVDNACNEFFVSGVNGWLVAENGSGPYLSLLQQENLNTLRFFAHGTDASWVIQTSPGVYNEAHLQAIDKVVAQLAAAGKRVILSLANNWKSPDGKKQYVAWVPGLRCNLGKCLSQPDDDAEFQCEQQNCPDEDLFFSDERVKTLFKNHIKFMLTRRNTVSGAIYGSDPAILAFDLMNEPNVKSTPACWGNNDITAGQQCVNILQSWLSDMTAFAKSIAPAALITVGYEGFYGPRASPQQLASNPRPPYSHPIDALYYASQAGQNFAQNLQTPGLDFGALHLWPDNWLVPRVDFVQSYLSQRVSDAASIGKPLIVEEFGKEANASAISTERDPFFKAVYDAVESSIRSDGAFKGSLFWEYGGNDDRAVRESDSTFSLIEADAKFIASYNAGGSNAVPVPNCAPGSIRSYQSITAGPARYVCFGDNLVIKAGSGPTTIQGPPATTLSACAQNCASAKGCNGFTFASNTCTLQQYTGSTFQPVWKVGSKSCLLVNPTTTAALGLAAEPVVTASGG